MTDDRKREPGRFVRQLVDAPKALVLVAFAMALSGDALANSGIGFLGAASPMLVLALGPVIVVEAVVLAKMLELTARRAFIVSLQANVLSTILGVVIAFAVDIVLGSLTDSSGYEPTKTATSTMLVPMFGITWCVEYFAIARLLPDKERRQVLGTTGLANLISYAGMFAAAWAFFPAHSSFPLRVAVYDGVSRAYSAKDAVGTFWAEQGRLPVSVQELPDGPAVFRQGITMEPSARVIVRLSPPGLPELDGKHLVFTPVLRSRDELEFKCSSPDIPPKYLPLHCR